MARRITTVADIADSIRSRIDELNRDTIDDDRDILPAMNRALDYAVGMYAKYYPDPFIITKEIEVTANQAEYDIPEDCFEDRILKVDLRVNSLFYQDITRISYRDLALYDANTATSYPYYYAIFSRKIRVVPPPSGNVSLKLWYIKRPETLVKPQGRIVQEPNTDKNYCIVDAPGADLSIENDQLANYFNVVNALTGEIRGTFQIKSIEDGRITIRTTLSSSDIWGRPVLNSFAGVGVKANDYICLVDGTCIPYYPSPTTNFIIQYAVAELSRQLGLSHADEEQVLTKFEGQLKGSWSGRENTTRIQKKSSAFGKPVGVFPLTQKGNGGGNSNG